jgi:hypothetical protein
VAHQKVGDNTGNRAAAFEYGVGERTHYPDPAAAKNQVYTPLRQLVAEGARRVFVRGGTAVR